MRCCGSLVSDDDSIVRASVAIHPSVPDDVLGQLENDTADTVQCVLSGGSFEDCARLLGIGEMENDYADVLECLASGGGPLDCGELLGREE